MTSPAHAKHAGAQAPYCLLVASGCSHSPVIASAETAPSHAQALATARKAVARKAAARVVAW
jgi:hypothetical protein